MQAENISRQHELRSPQSAVTGPVRTSLAIAFRRRNWLMAAIIGIVASSILAAFLAPYTAEMMVMVKHERIDAVVTPDDTNKMLPPRDQNVNEADLNSEVELLQSSDLKQKVVLASGLYDPQNPPFSLRKLIPWRDKSLDEPKAIAREVSKLSSHLDVRPLRLTNLIQITYKNRDPEMAAKVLKALAPLYLQKHIQVHASPAGTGFFAEQAVRYRESLEKSENALKTFGSDASVNPLQERDIVVTKLSDFKVNLQQTRAGILSAQNRINDLRRQFSAVNPRQTTTLRNVQNPQLEEKLRGTLLDLELKRTDLLTKYQPTYRAVQEVDAQIQQSRDALAEMHKNPMKEDTTDVDPVYAWVKAELAKAEADKASLEAHATATERSIANYEQNALRLNTLALQQTGLQREAKAQEANYLLYTQKLEESRISEEFDRQRVVNVALAEEPSVPVLPSHPRILYAAAIGMMMTFFWAILLWLRDRLDPSLRTPDEVIALLGIPVLAAIPSQTK